jgi:hypothetical protein
MLMYLEEPGGVHAHHAQKAEGCHQMGGESHEVLARGAVQIMGPFQGQSHINKEIVQPECT